MKVFGRAWLQFEIDEHGDEVEIRQTALYDPHGLTGLFYWYTLYPLHELVFGGMLRNIARHASNLDTTQRRPLPRRTVPRPETWPGAPRD